MAQWSRADRTLNAKIVYYGPAFGGKTTNLVSLHRITDPGGRNELLTLETADDRTLFFDLLPFDLGDILGYQVAVKLYTVPGQVRYETTRQVVLSGADAVIFVADASPDRMEQNRWSLQNLQMNLRSNHLDPKTLPILYQFNKQDVPGALAPAAHARELGLDAEAAIPSVATDGTGVLETFMQATRAMLRRLAELADEPTRRQFDIAQLESHLERTFRPYVDRVAAGAAVDEAPRITLESNDEEMLAAAVQSQVELAERLGTQRDRAARLEREAESLRQLVDSSIELGASFDRAALVRATLDAGAGCLAARDASLVWAEGEQGFRCEAAWRGDDDPFLRRRDGGALVARMLATGRPCLVDLDEEFGAAARESFPEQRAAAVIPVRREEGGALIVYAARPDGRLDPLDIRFLVTLAGNLAIGLHRSELHLQVETQRDRLRGEVEARTVDLRRAYDQLRGLDEMKDRFLTNLSHEMKTPLTAILSSAHALHSYDGSVEERREMSGTVIAAGQRLHGLLDGLFRVVGCEEETQPLRPVPLVVRELAREGVRLAGVAGVKARIEKAGELCADRGRMARAIANLIGNARKFSPADTQVDLYIRPLRGAEGEEGLGFSVLDKGPGVADEDLQRIFSPFEQGGSGLTDKPSGFGLGLHEARTIARRHGGELSYHRRRGGGSEFRIWIPREPATVGAAGVSTTGAAGAR